MCFVYPDGLEHVRVCTPINELAYCLIINLCIATCVELFLEYIATLHEIRSSTNCHLLITSKTFKGINYYPCGLVTANAICKELRAPC